MTEKLITNRYQIISKLGQGGMGAVWRVYDRLEKSDIALKQVLIPDNKLMFASKAGTADAEKLRLSLAREFSILASLRHPNILSVLDYGFDSEQLPYFTMPLVAQPNTIIAYGKNLTFDEKAKLVIQMLQAVHYLHRRNIFHRDLKPDNVLITADGEVKVLDFGLSVTVEQAQGSVGTLPYMAPEVLRNGAISPASDLYAIGLIAYELFAGQFPYPTNNAMKLMRAIMNTLPDMSLIGHVGIETVLMRLLSKDPDDRFQSADATIRALREALEIDILYESIAIRESFLQASEFVGRDAELQMLTDELNLMLEGRTAFYLVGGESGVGKSRLLDELRINALVSGVTVLRGQGVEGRGLPYQLWRNIVRRLVLMVEVTNLQLGILIDIVTDIGELVGRPVKKAPTILTGKAYQNRLVQAIVDLFREVNQPILLLLEDLQWTVESLAVLKQILLVRDQFDHLMIVGSYRNDEAPHLSNELMKMEIMQLHRLDRIAMQALTQSMIGQQGASETVIDLLQKETEGNLFFLVETVRALAEESGGLEYVGKVTLPDSVFTGGMQAITRRRLSKVDIQYSDLQTIAAIIGREIDMRLLVHTFDDATVQAWLRNAAEYGVVAIQHNTWHFAHDKLRETIIADIPDDERPQTHRNVAKAIEAIYPDDDGYNEALLKHWQQVGDFDKIYHYTLPVAQNMIEIKGTFTVAETLLKYCLNRLPSDDTRNFALWNWLARSALRQGNYHVGQTYARQTQRGATTRNTKDELAISLHHLGNIALRQGEYEQATNFHQQSLKIKQALGKQLDIATSLNNLGVIAYLQGDYVRASELYQRSLAINQQFGEQYGIAMSLNNLSEISRIQGEYERAVDLYQLNLELCQQIGEQGGMSICLNNLGLIAHAQALYSQATDFFQQSLTIRQKLGDQRGIASSLNKLGRANQKQKILSYQLFQQSLAIAHKIQTIPLILANVVGFAEYFIEQGHIERAAQLVGLVQYHPTQDSDVRQYLEEILPQLEVVLSPYDLQVALQQGKDLNLNTVVQDLLDEFGMSEDDI